MSGVARLLCSNISHGDQKLLDIGLALALEPQVLLLDEPTAGLGPEERWQMIGPVRRLWEQGGLKLVFIEHDMATGVEVAQKFRVPLYSSVLAQAPAGHHPHTTAAHT